MFKPDCGSWVRILLGAAPKVSRKPVHMAHLPLNKICKAANRPYNTIPFYKSDKGVWGGDNELLHEKMTRGISKKNSCFFFFGGGGSQVLLTSWHHLNVCRNDSYSHPQKHEGNTAHASAASTEQTELRGDIFSLIFKLLKYMYLCDGPEFWRQTWNTKPKPPK